MERCSRAARKACNGIVAPRTTSLMSGHAEALCAGENLSGPGRPSVDPKADVFHSALLLTHGPAEGPHGRVTIAVLRREDRGARLSVRRPRKAPAWRYRGPETETYGGQSPHLERGRTGAA